MGKRTREKSDDEIISKIKRLEKELQSRQKPPINNLNEDREYDIYNYQEDSEINGYAGNSVSGEEFVPGHQPLDYEEAASNTTDVPAPSPEEELHEEANGRVKSIVFEAPPSSTPVQMDEDTIPIEILEVLGEAKRSEEIFGKKIPLEISERLGKILVEGLGKEQKETLLSKTLIPENFKLAKAPKLNAEVASILIDTAKNRDKRLEKMQNQLGSGIAGLANLTSELISTDLSKIEIIKKISEVNQILLDLHFEETANRRRLIIPMLDKSFITIIQGVKRDKFLFGDNLGDNIKTTKSLEKSGLQIKKSVPPQPSTSRKPAGQQGNLRQPPRSASGAVAARAPPAQSRYYLPPPPPPPAARRPPMPGSARWQPPPPPSRSQDRRSRR